MFNIIAKTKPFRPGPALYLAGLALAVLGFSYFYVSTERTYYFWDYANFQGWANLSADEFGGSFGQGWALLGLSMQAEQNFIFTLPLVPFLLIFGKSRLVYELAMALVYLLPFPLILGALAVKVIPGPPRPIFWLTVACALVLPTNWLPLFQGYPDVGGALLIALAILVYLQDTNLSKTWQIPLIGVLLAGAILFRRTFSYDCLAFFGSLALYNLARFAGPLRAEPGLAFQKLFRLAVRVAVVAGFAFIFLVAFGLTFVQRILAINYNQLFSSYIYPWYDCLGWYGQAFGWLTWLGAGVGFGIGFYRRRLAAPAGFIAIFGAWNVLQWIFVVGQESDHYTLHFSVAVTLGLVALFWLGWETWKGKARRVFVGAAGLLLAVNFLLGLLWPGTLAGSPLRALFAEDWNPTVRSDYQEIGRLVDYMRGAASPQDKILVVASSVTFNEDILRKAENARYGAEGSRLAIMDPPHVDSRDHYPLGELLQAQYVVLADPFQHHLPEKEQGVVRVVYDLFRQNRSIAQDFTLVPGGFNLENGVSLRLYRRINPTALATALESLRIMQEYTRVQPAGQTDWQSAFSSYPVSSDKILDGSTHLKLLPGNQADLPGLTFFYTNKLPGQARISGKILFQGQDCPALNLSFYSLSSDFKKTNLARVSRRPDDNGPFEVVAPEARGNFVLFDLSANENRPLPPGCAVEIVLNPVTAA